MDFFSNPGSASETKPANLIAPEILISLATGPLLVGLVGGKAIAKALQELGELSEEIFRGDRLPLLNFPDTAETHPDNPELV